MPHKKLLFLLPVLALLLFVAFGLLQIKTGPPGSFVRWCSILQGTLTKQIVYKQEIAESYKLWCDFSWLNWVNFIEGSGNGPDF